jgi:uncharacterized membrane protein
MHTSGGESQTILGVFGQLVDVVLTLVLVGLFVGTVVAGGRILPLETGNPVRVAIVLVGLLVLPGYALTTALFPVASSGADAEESQSPLARAASVTTESMQRASGLTAAERAAVSFGASLALVPLVAFAFALAVPGVPVQSIVLALAAITVLSILVGAVRRLRTPPTARYAAIPYGAPERVRRVLVGNKSIDTALNIVVVIGILAATGAFGVALTAPQDATDYTGFSLLAENESGELVTADYPSNLTGGEPESLVFAVDNQEGQQVTYEVVVQFQRVDNGSVVERTTLDSYRQRVAAGGTWQRRHTVTPTLTGDHLRLTYLLYRGDAPRTPTRSSAYRSLHLWVSVAEPGGGPNATAANATAANATSPNATS